MTSSPLAAVQKSQSASGSQSSGEKYAAARDPLSTTLDFSNASRSLSGSCVNFLKYVTGFRRSCTIPSLTNFLNVLPVCVSCAAQVPYTRALYSIIQDVTVHRERVMPRFEVEPERERNVEPEEEPDRDRIHVRGVLRGRLQGLIRSSMTTTTLCLH